MLKPYVNPWLVHDLTETPIAPVNITYKVLDCKFGSNSLEKIKFNSFTLIDTCSFYQNIKTIYDIVLNYKH